MRQRDLLYVRILDTVCKYTSTARVNGTPLRNLDRNNEGIGLV